MLWDELHSLEKGLSYYFILTHIEILYLCHKMGSQDVLAWLELLSYLPVYCSRLHILCKRKVCINLFRFLSLYCIFISLPYIDIIYICYISFNNDLVQCAIEWLSLVLIQQWQNWNVKVAYPYFWEPGQHKVFCVGKQQGQLHLQRKHANQPFCNVWLLQCTYSTNNDIYALVLFGSVAVLLYYVNIFWMHV